MQTQSGFNFFLERKNEPRLDKSRNLKKTKAWQEGDFYIMYFNKQLSSNDLSHDINIGLFFKVHKGLFKNLNDFLWGLFRTSLSGSILFEKLKIFLLAKTLRTNYYYFFIRKLFQSMKLCIEGIFRLASKCAWQFVIATLPDGS